MGTVATVEDFWQLHQLIKPPSCLAIANDYAMFRQVNFQAPILLRKLIQINLLQGVNPDWDDPANSGGGRCQ